MHILLTGGGGYLGSVLLGELLQRGHRVRIFDRFAFGDSAVADVAQDAAVEVVTGDVRRLQEHPGLLDGIEAVAHLASLSNDPTCALDPEMAHDVNVASTQELARVASQRGVSRFLLASSCTVYGRGVFELLDEQSPANPVAPFGQTKLAAEEAVLALRGDGFLPLVARTASMFGWSPRMRFDLALNQMVGTALLQGRIAVRGGGQQWRPFVHVRDAARAFATLLEAPRERLEGGTYNVGRDDYNLPVFELAQRVAARLGGVPVDVQTDDPDARSFRVQFGKLAALGFRPEHDIEAAVDEVRTGIDREGVRDLFTEQYANVVRYRRLRAMPVDEGGEPLAARFIPLARPSLGEAEEEAMLAAMRSGWVTSGPQIAAFEQGFKQLVGAEHVVGVSSCTAAIHLALVDLGVGPGDEVILSPITWASVGNIVVHLGARIVFADVEADSLNLDPAKLAGYITERTKAIIPVHMAGHPARLDEILAIAAAHGVPVIEDAAHAVGTAYHGQPIGGTSDLACFSFYATKNLTTIEGGAIAVRDAERAARLRCLASNGMAATAWDRYSRSAQAAPPEVVVPGFKYAMGNIHAALGVQQLRKFPAHQAARRRIAHLYLSVLGEVDELALPVEQGDIVHAWHLFIVRLRLETLRKTRNEIAYELRRENIGTGVHFYGLHLHQYYRETLGYRPEDAPIATQVSHEVLSLPLYPGMSDKDVHDVVSALKKVLAHARN